MRELSLNETMCLCENITMHFEYRPIRGTYIVGSA